MRHLLPLAALSWTAGCAPFGPNATGRWTGTVTCADDAEYRVVMEVAEESGSGGELEGTVWVFDEDGSVDDAAEGFVDGYRDRREISLEWVLVGGWTFDLQGNLKGDRLHAEGELTGGWLVESCTVGLDR